jgi:hypothetical protein
MLARQNMSQVFHEGRECPYAALKFDAAGCFTHSVAPALGSPTVEGLQFSPLFVRESFRFTRKLPEF